MSVGAVAFLQFWQPGLGAQTETQYMSRVSPVFHTVVYQSLYLGTRLGEDRIPD